MTELFKKLALFAAGWLVVGLPALGQRASAGAKGPAFDVAAIRFNKTGNRTALMPTTDGIIVIDAPLKVLLVYAYSLKTDDLISGLPGWANSARFDVTAKMDDDTVTALKKLPNDERWDQTRLMMQSLLEDRFRLKVRHVSKDLSMYTLVIAKNGSKLKDADPKNTYPKGIRSPVGIPNLGMVAFYRGHLKGQAVPILGLVNFLSGYLHREVMDKTGLTGKYDFTLAWSPEENEAPAVPGGQQDMTATDASGPSIFTALQEQLGLKLESTKGPVDTIVVDHVEMPSEN